MIEVKNLTRKFKDLVAINNVSFTLEKGDILGFLGPNGAGKTTTMRIITGYIPATSGTVNVAGYDIFENPLAVKKRIGYLPEHPPLYQELTVKDYLSYVANLKGVDGRKIQSELGRVTELCSLEAVFNRLIDNISKGFRQRVGLAQAMIGDPEILILDEPTVGLDPNQIMEVREMIKNLAQNHTVILSTHILPEVTMTCQRVVIIHQGKVKAEDSIDGLLSRFHRSYRIHVQTRSGDGQLVQNLESIQGVNRVLPGNNGQGSFVVEADDKGIREVVAQKIVESGAGLLELHSSTISLEEVFKELTTEEKGVQNG